MRGAGVDRLAPPALLDGFVGDGWGAWPCRRIRAELRLRGGFVGRCGARVGHGLRPVRARHGATIALLASCVAGCLLLPSSVLFVVLVAPERVAVGLAWLMVMAAFIVVPLLSCRGPDRLPGPSDGDDGGGSGPDRPPASPEPPDGGVPLPDADPSRARRRDHGSPKVRYLTRWRAREPERGPAPAPRDQ